MSCNCSPATRVLPNSFQELENTSGNLTITAVRANTTIDLTIGGVARTSLIILSRVRRRAGDIISFRMVLPATPDIVLEFRNGADDGATLLPATYPDQQFTTDGVILSANLRFIYTGSEWRYLDGKRPA